MVQSQQRNTCREIVPTPYVHKVAGIVLGIVNCIIPGLGLAIAALLEPGQVNCYYLAIALCQFLFTFLIFGWIWSFINGVLMIIEVTKSDYEQRRKYFEEQAKQPNAPAEPYAQVQQANQ